MVAGSFNRVTSQHGGAEMEAESALTRCTAATERSVDAYPLTWTLGAFAIGIGLGAAIGAAMARPLGFRHEAVAANVGRRVLDSIYDVLPESVQRHMR